MKKTLVTAFLLWSCCTLHAQETEVAGMKKDFQAYQSAHLQEKIYVQTDKTVYLAGETIWFKIYSLLEQWHQLSTVSRVVYVELSSPALKIPLQEKINMDSGKGSGSLQLPTRWPSGNYILRAYTSWMKNFPEEFFYTQSLSVISPAYGPSAKHAAGPALPAGKNAPAALPAAVSSVVHFFPEGGNLPYGTETKIAFRFIDEAAQERPCAGFIINQKNDTLARFNSPATALHPGTGHFYLTVPPGDSLFAYEYAGEKAVRIPFPSAVASGYALRLAEINPSYLSFSVRAPLSENNKQVFLLVHTRQVLKSIQSAPIKDGMANFTVDRALLDEGISVFTLFDLDRRPVGERLFFSLPQKYSLQIQVAQPRYDHRAAVSVQLLATNNDGKGTSGELSLSVFRLDSLEKAVNPKNIFFWYYLSSELRGKIENPASYFGTGKDTLEAADDLMLTQGWRRFSWDKIFRNKISGFTFLPEEEGPVLSAHAENRVTNLPAAGVSFFLSFPGKEFQFSTASADKNGNLLFTAPPFSGTTSGIILPAISKDSGLQVDTDPAYSESPFPPVPGMPPLPEAFAAILTERALSLQIENAYRPEEKKKLLPGATIDSVPFYGKPDRSFHLANYIRYPTMEEIMREFVEDVRVRKDGKNFRLRVMNLLFKTFFEEDPMILLDGVPVSDPGKIMQIDPMKISDIDVVSHRFFKGSVTFQGLISFRSVAGDLGQTVLDPGAVLVDFEGLQQQREFYAPVYADSAMHDRPIPDYRTTIAWIPRLKTNAEGKKDIQFYTSDVRGRFAMIAEGISSDGKPLSGMTFFEVGK